jgi:glycolate oxidase FAD binding subunit
MLSSNKLSPNGSILIDGVMAAGRVAPTTPVEVAELLAESSEQGMAVVPVGGGTALSLGNPPERADLVLSTERLSRVIDYEPTDLVLSVEAGARLGDVQAILGEHGQRLPIDPPGGADATIGGLIATARWGPLRHSAGTLRDLLIGISVAHPDGSVSKAGGMVVKNVSGYDMPRVYHGSLGTLGIITSANFKVLPRPRTEATLVVTFQTPGPAFALAGQLRAGGAPLAALDVRLQDGSWNTAVRIEGREQTVELVVRNIAANVKGDVARLEGLESRGWWDAHVAIQQARPNRQEIIVRAGVRPRVTETLAGGILAIANQLNAQIADLVASPGIGSVVARVGFAYGSPELLAELQAMLLDLAETVTILSAPSGWKRGLDIWGRLPDGFDVMKAMRAQFDPSRTINPGRFAGYL